MFADKILTFWTWALVFVWWHFKKQFFVCSGGAFWLVGFFVLFRFVCLFICWVGLEGFLLNYLCFYYTVVMPMTQTSQQLLIAELLGGSVRVLWVNPCWRAAGSVPTSSHPSSFSPWVTSDSSCPLLLLVDTQLLHHPSPGSSSLLPPEHPQNFCTDDMGLFCIRDVQESAP